jgi:hypothetical protein
LGQKHDDEKQQKRPTGCANGSHGSPGMLHVNPLPSSG